MMTFEEIKEQMRKNSELIKELKDKNKAMRWNDKQDWEANTDKFAENEQKAEELAIMNKILMDNARQVLFAQLMPWFTEILRKYKGKPYGEKTKKKISDEMNDTTGFHVCIENRSYADYQEIHFYGQGFSGKLEAYPRYDGKSFPRLLVENRINPDVLDTYYLGYCAEYVEDPSLRAKEILDAMADAKKAFAALEKACSAYNGLLPSGIEHEYQYSFKGYIQGL